MLPPSPPAATVSSPAARLERAYYSSAFVLLASLIVLAAQPVQAQEIGKEVEASAQRGVLGYLECVDVVYARCGAPSWTARLSAAHRWCNRLHPG